MIYSSSTAYEISILTGRHCIRFTEMAFVVVAVFDKGRPQFVSKQALHKQACHANINRGISLDKEWKINPKTKMFTAKDFNGLRSRNLNEVVALTDELKSSSVAVRSCDPIQVWEKHPVISKYLDALKDKEIAFAIDAVNA